MKKSDIKNKFSNAVKTKQFKKGSYSTAVMVIILGIAIVINLLVGSLPTSFKNIDISSNEFYTIGDVSKEVIDNIQYDIDIIVTTAKADVDTRISTLLDKYADSSEHISIEYIDSVLYPSVLTTYSTTADTVVVKCEDTDKTTTIPFTDIIVYDETYYYYYGYTIETEFDGEGQITTALDYVSNDNDKVIYELEGHSETALGSNVSELIEKSNFTVSSVNILTNNGIPDDCSMIICNLPLRDLADDELELLREYLAGGGNIILLLSDSADDTPNFDSLMADYGISTVEGYIADTERYYGQSIYQIFPEYSSGNITGALSDNSDYTLIYGSTGLNIEAVDDSISTDAFLVTSSSGAAVISETDYSTGVYTLAVQAVQTIEEDTEETEETEDTESISSTFTVYGASTIIDNDLTSYYTNLYNLDVFMSSITACFDDVSNISIASISLETSYNTFTNANTIGAIFIFVIPIILIVVGIVRWVKRRKL